jgi:hypothetical protein
MNFLDSIQRREVIDEDKKIHKRALDSEFAFIKRIGEDNLPPSSVDRRVAFTISNYIQEIAQNLEGSYNEASRDEQKGEKYVVFDLGQAVDDWNKLVTYMKFYRPAERLSAKDYSEFWQELSERVLPLTYQIDNLYNQIQARLGVPKRGRPANEGVVFVDQPILKELQNRIESQNLSIINTSATLSKSQTQALAQAKGQAIPVDILEEMTKRAKEAIEQKLGDELQAFFQDPDDFEDLDKKEKSLYRRAKTILKKLKIPDTDEFIRKIFTDIADDISVVYPFVDEDEDDEDEDEDEDEEGQGGVFDAEYEVEEEGNGKPKRKNKKKMGEDELQLDIEFKDAKGLVDLDKKMKKPEKKKSYMLYDDSRDSNYLK